MTDTTIPTPGTTLVPDATSGVLVVSATGGYDCPDGQACIAIGIIMSGSITATAADGSGETTAIDAEGRAGVRLAPGTYDITATVTAGSCAPSTATVVAGTTADVALSCSVPLP
jgi:hypothetical protein